MILFYFKQVTLALLFDLGKLWNVGLKLTEKKMEGISLKAFAVQNFACKAIKGEQIDV